MPANLLNVPDSDAASLGLPVCGGGSTPTPVPTATPVPRPTATPMPGGDTLADFLALANGNADDLRQAFGDTYTMHPDSPGSAGWDQNGRGWFASRNTWWSTDYLGGKRWASCLMIIYDNASSAALDDEYDAMVRYTEGSLDVLVERKVDSLVTRAFRVGSAA